MLTMNNADYIQDYDTGYVYNHDGKKINSISGSLLNCDNTQPVADEIKNKYSGISIGDDIYYATTQKQHDAINYYSYRVQKIRATTKYRGMLHSKYEQQLYNEIESMYISVLDKCNEKKRIAYTTNTKYAYFEKMLIEYKLDLINEYRYKITHLIDQFHDALMNYNCSKMKLQCIKKIYLPKQDYNSIISYKRNVYYEKKYLQDYKMIMYKQRFMLHCELQNTYNIIKHVVLNLSSYKCM